MSRVRNLASVVLLAFTGLAAPSSAWAEQQFWVSVGSFKTSQQAEAAMRQAGEKLIESFSIIGTDTTKGYYYRVAAGPFRDRQTALSRVQAAKAEGYSGAWMWSDDSSVFTGSTLSSQNLLDDSYDIDLQSLDAGFDLDDDSYLQDYGDTPNLDDEAIRERTEVPQLIEEAPENYKLNKLRRDASAWPPPQVQSREPTPLVPGTSPSQLIIDIGNPITLGKFQDSQIDITIDGILDEPQWTQLPGVDNFTVVDPDTGDTPEHRTIVKMFYTDAGIYASFEMEQPQSTLVQWYSGRDEGGLNRDNVGVTLDTSGEGRYGYWVNLALGGNQVDGTVLPERQFSGDWDGAWYGGTQVTETGWNAEIFIPWSQMAMPKESGERKINAYASRKVAYLGERWTVPALPFTQPLFMSALQPLVVNEVDPRQQWSLFPYASVTQDEVEGYTQVKAGADVFWRPSTNFQMTATLNPDFGNVESDDVIVNLSAFETFFSEKRLFFQESTEVFNATPRARGGNPITALNTRRIGGRARAPAVADDIEVPDRELGQPIELMGAVKAVGQMGNVRYGVLAAAEDEAKFDVGDINYYQDGSDYGVARLLYETKGVNGDYRAIGTISTLAAHPEQDATVHGVDYHYLTASGVLKIDGQMLYSDKDDVGSGSGGFVDVRYNPSRSIIAGLGISHFDDTIDINDLGFLRRNDATAYKGYVDYSRADLAWVRKAYLRSFVDFEHNSDGAQTRKGVGTRLHLDLNNRDKLRMGLAYFPARDEDRDSRDNGTFRIDSRTATSLDYSTDSSKRVSYSVGFNYDGEPMGGHRSQGKLGVVWRPVDQINIGASAHYQVRDGWLLWQDERNFTTFETHEWRPKLNVDYFLSAKQQLRLSAQWVGIKAQEKDFFLVPLDEGRLASAVDPDPTEGDFSISRVNLQLRYRWEIAPLSELFVVYTLNGEYNAGVESFDDLFQQAYDEPVGEQLVVKLRYRLGS